MTHIRRRLICHSLLLALVAAAGCDSVSHEQYQGNVLATIQGSVVVAPAYMPPPSEAVLLWTEARGSIGNETFVDIAEKVAVQGTFPAAFQLDVHQPPPAAAGITFDGARINIARITAWEAGVLKAGQQIVEIGKSPLGYASEYLVHLDRDVPETHPFKTWLGVNQKGFHLVHYVSKRLTPAEIKQQNDACEKLFGNPQSCGPGPAIPAGGPSETQFPVYELVPGDLAGHRVTVEIRDPFAGPGITK
jgi:hypothetical protein